MFAAIGNEDNETLRTIANKYESQDTTIWILCLDKILKYFPTRITGSHKQIITKLSDMAKLNSGIVALVIRARPRESAELSRLTGFKVAIDPPTDEQLVGYFHVLKGSWIHKRLGSKVKNISLIKLNSSILIKGEHLDEFIKLACETRVRGIVNYVQQKLSAAPIRPCLDFALDPSKSCRRDKDCPDEHTTDLSLEAARLRVHLHLYIIRAMHAMRDVHWPDNSPTTRANIRRRWVERMHAVMFPVWYGFGNDQILRTPLEPEIQDAVAKFWTWLHDYTDELNPVADDEELHSAFLTEVISTAMLVYRWPKRLGGTTWFEDADHLFYPRDDLTMQGRGETVISQMVNFYGRIKDGALEDGVAVVRCVTKLLNDASAD